MQKHSSAFAETSMPWLSVIVPAHNGAEYLAEALDSIASQGDEEIEVLAVDDGSKDATRAILEESISRLPLQIIDQSRTGNWAANTNRALERARGEWVCILHQDDRWRPGRLGCLRSVLRRQPEREPFGPCRLNNN